MRPSSSRLTRLTAAVALSLGLAGSLHAAVAPAGAATAATAATPAVPGVRIGQGIAVQVIGEGRPVIMIPGLSSGAGTWRDTCAALQSAHVQCHLVQLPGFAGLPPVAHGDHYLDAMSQALLDYIRQRHLVRPVVVGHSLGGVLALKMAIEQPQAIDKLVIVDALPFLPAVQNPAATAAAMRPLAEGMRQRLLGADAAAYRAQVEATARAMVHAPARAAQIARWGVASDRATTAEAMAELMTTDLRPALGAICAPTLVLGSWAPYAPYGATEDSTAAVFRAQYAKLRDVRVAMSQAGYHFLMWDDPQWLQAQLRGFIDDKAAR